MAMTPQEKIDCIRLLHTDGVGLVTFHKLITKFTSPTRAINYLENRPTTSSKKFAIAPSHIAEQDLFLADSLGATVLFYNDDNYPTLLRQIPDAPAVLYVLGNTSALSGKNVALVGSRNASINSKSLPKAIPETIV